MIHQDNPVFSQIEEAQKTEGSSTEGTQYNKFVGSIILGIAVLLIVVFG